MKAALIILFCVLSFNGFGQSYNIDIVILKTDSVLRSCVGNDACQYFSGYYFYSYRTKSGKLKHHQISGKTTKGKFAGCGFHLYFNYPGFTGLLGQTTFELNDVFRLKNEPYFEFVPKFLLEGKECNYIKQDKIFAIADSLKINRGIKPMSGFLEYDLFNLGKQYYWLITNYLTENRDRFGNTYGKCEEFIIDPISAKVLQHYNSTYGPLY